MADKKKKQSLGRGLDEIFGGDVNEVIENIKENRSDKTNQDIPLTKLMPNPFQPRKEFDIYELKGLATSIKENGLFTPIIVKENEAGKYYIVAGERRTRAAKLAGLKNIKAIVVNITDAEMQRITLVENIQREDLNPIEIAISIESMIREQKITQSEAAKVIGKSRPYVANLLGILKLDKRIINAVLSGRITYGHAKPLITLSQKEAISIYKKILEQELSVKETNNYAKAAKLRSARGNKKPSVVERKEQEIIYAEELVRNKLKSKVEITSNEIKIKYRGREQLSRILERMEALEK